MLLRSKWHGITHADRITKGILGKNNRIGTLKTSHFKKHRFCHIIQQRRIKMLDNDDLGDEQIRWEFLKHERIYRLFLKKSCRRGKKRGTISRGKS